MPWLKRPLSTFSLPDVRSIRFRLTTGVLLVSALGIGSLTTWMTWRMQAILLDSHRQATAAVSQRLQEDIEIYDDMMPRVAALQKAIDLRALGDTAIWVRSPQGSPMAASETLSMGMWRDEVVAAYLTTLPTEAQLVIDTVADRTFVTCIGPLTIAGEPMGTLFVVEDISYSQQAFRTLTRHLVLFSGGTLLGLAGLLFLFIQRSLHPLKVLSQTVGAMTPEALPQTRLHLDRAPTEVRELAQALDQTLDQLAQAWDDQRRLVGDVSHELRTPLTLVQGYLQSTLRRCQTLPEAHREGLETASAETDRTIHLLNNLLILARARNGYLPLAHDYLDLKQVVMDTLAQGSFVGDRLEFEGVTAPLWIRGDANALRQVLSNLLDNALHYSAPEQRVTILLAQRGNRALLQVRDRGRGIPLADQANIFEPFYRVDADRCRITGGTGLGLAIAKTLIVKMDGTLSVQSTLGEGSTFTMDLPLAVK